MRSSRYELEFDKSLESIFGRAQRADDRMMAVEWTLSRATTSHLATHPLLGVTADGIQVRLFKTIETPHFPSMLVVFGISADNKYVIYYDIRLGSTRPISASEGD